MNLTNYRLAQLFILVEMGLKKKPIFDPYDGNNAVYVKYWQRVNSYYEAMRIEDK